MQVNIEFDLTFLQPIPCFCLLSLNTLLLLHLENFHRENGLVPVARHRMPDNWRLIVN